MSGAAAWLSLRMIGSNTGWSTIRFLQRVEQARNSLPAKHGVKLEDIDTE